MIVPGDLATFLIRQCVCVCVRGLRNDKAGGRKHLFAIAGGHMRDASYWRQQLPFRICELMEAATLFPHIFLDVSL